MQTQSVRADPGVGHLRVQVQVFQDQAQVDPRAPLARRQPRHCRTNVYQGGRRKVCQKRPVLVARQSQV